jgi:hypothetical protein
MAIDTPDDYDSGERLLSQAIVDTLREPLVVLDHDLRVVVASRSFYSKFQVAPDATEGRLLRDLGGSQWNISALLALLERIAPDRATLIDYEVTVELPNLGERTLLLNANKLYYEYNHSSQILLAFEDVTERRQLERERDDLLMQKDLLLQEMQHRVANSLSIIASILLLKARTVPFARDAGLSGGSASARALGGRSPAPAAADKNWPAGQYRPLPDRALRQLGRLHDQGRRLPDRRQGGRRQDDIDRGSQRRSGRD